MTSDELQLSSGLFWTSAIITALVDAAFILLLVWRIKPTCFRELRRPLVAASALLWSLFALFLVGSYWEDYYSIFFPAWFRAGGIVLLAAPVYALFALVFHWLSLRGRFHPILTFCLLAGVESLVEHAGGIYGMGILRIPMLQEASPLSIFAFAFPEYVFYWCIVITVAALLHPAWRGIQPGVGFRKRNSI